MFKILLLSHPGQVGRILLLFMYMYITYLLPYSFWWNIFLEDLAVALHHIYIHRWPLSPISVVNDIALDLISEPLILD